MKKTLLILLTAVLTAHGLTLPYTVDISTLTTNQLTNSALITLPSAGLTNTPYITVNTNYIMQGDSVYTAFWKVNYDLQFLNANSSGSGTATNLAGGALGQVTNIVQAMTNGLGGITNLVGTNAANPSVSGGTGFIPTNSAGGGMTNVCVTNNGVIFQFKTNGQFVFTNTLTHAFTAWDTNALPTSVDQYGGMEQRGTNWWTVNFTNGQSVTFSNGLLTVNSNLLANGSLSVNGTTWLNNSNLVFSTSTNSYLIPNMTGSDTQSGIATASSYVGVNYPWCAFQTNSTLYWFNYTSPSWVQYQFPSPVPVSGSIVKCTGSGNSLYFEYSNDGINWNVVSTNTLNQFAAVTYFLPNQVMAQYFRWQFIPAQVGGLYGIQLFSYANIMSNSFMLGIVSSNGVTINTNSLSPNTDGTTSILNENGSMNNTGGYYVNGVPIGQIYGVSTNTGTTNPGTTGTTFDPATVNYFSGCDATFSTNYNGYTHYTFFSTLPNYFTYNPLPTGAFFFVYPLKKLGQSGDGSPTVTIIGYTYVFYLPNGNVSTNAPTTPIQTLNAVNDLVLNLKSAGLWTSLTNYAVYPFADAALGCNANNLMGPNFTLLWNGSLTSTNAHTAYGVSNYNGWADTQFKATSATNLTLVAFVMASGSSPTNYLISAYDGTNYADLALAGTNLLEAVGATNQGVQAYLNLTNDFFAVTRQNGTAETGLIDATNVYTRTVALNGVSGSNIVLFAQSPGFNMATNLILGFAMIGPALTANQMATLQNVVSQYEYEMGRLPGGQISTNTLAASTSYMTTSNVLSAISATNLANLTITTNLITAATNNLVTASITNGLASTNYVNAATNGLATISYVNASTNGAFYMNAMDNLALTGKIGGTNQPLLGMFQLGGVDYYGFRWDVEGAVTGNLYLRGVNAGVETTPLLTVSKGSKILLGSDGTAYNSPVQTLDVVNNTYVQAMFRSTGAGGGLDMMNSGGYVFEIQSCTGNFFTIYDRTAYQYRFSIFANGLTTIGSNNSLGAQVGSDIQAPTTIGLNIRGAASQTADYLDVTSSTGGYGNVFSINANGNVNVASNITAAAFIGNGSGLTNLAWSAITNAPVIPTTNGFVTASITNGLASTNYVNAATSGLVTTNFVLSSITATNLANLTITTNLITAATNNLVTSSITNGLATTAFVTAQGYVTSAVTNGLAGTNTPGAVNMTNSANKLGGTFTGTVDYQNGNPAIGLSPLYLGVGANALYYPDGSPFAFATNSWVQMSWPSGFGAMNNTNGALVLPYLGAGRGGLANVFGTQILDVFGNFSTPLNATTLQGLSVTNFLLVTNNLTIAGGTNGIGSAAGGVGGIVNIANGGSSGNGTPGAGGTVNIATSGTTGGFDFNGGTVNIATSLEGTGGTVNLATASDGIAGTVNAGNINAGNVAGTFIGNGSQLTGLSASQIAGLPTTNGLASTNYVNAATSGLVTTNFVLSSIATTNLANLTITTNLITAATNNLVTASITNGLATTNYVNAATNGLATTNYVLTRGYITNLTATNTTTLSPGSSATVNCGVVGGIGWISIGVPQGLTGATGAMGAAGTNTVTNIFTAFNFTNQVLGNRQTVLFSTNNFTFGTSNFLARVPNLYNELMEPGMLGAAGLTPGTNVFEQLWGSVTGTNGWFVVTNGFWTTNAISISAVGAGGGIGMVTLYGVDHYELLGVTNSYFGEYQQFNEPQNASDAATKNYVDVAVANALPGNWLQYTDTNFLQHLVCMQQSVTVVDIASVPNWIGITGNSISGTNLLFTAYATNLVAGFWLESETNLSLANSFLLMTNYTLSTNSGVATFTVPIFPNVPMAFFRLRSPGKSSMTFSGPLISPATIYPSNTWSLANITNWMHNGDIVTVNSNGVKLVDVQLSNGVVILHPHW